MFTIPDDAPARISALPRDHRGYPVPWFVARVDGRPCFPCADSAKVVEAVAARRCWVCGDQLGRNLAYVIGPMCVVNRVSAEPPCHLECAEFSARHCPFLSRPAMGRVPASHLPDRREDPPGLMIARNPGVCCVWVTRTYRLRRLPGDRRGGVLFDVAEPSAPPRWFCEGRAATAAEVAASVSSGLPLLRQAAEADGPAAVAMLGRMVAKAVPMFPAPWPAEAAAEVCG